MIIRLLFAFGPVLAGALLVRWTIGMSTPNADRRRMMRAIGWLERLGTRYDALLSRVSVWCVDRFGIDQLRWERLHQRYRLGLWGIGDGN